MIGIIGPEGVGKSTILNAFCTPGTATLPLPSPSAAPLPSPAAAAASPSSAAASLAVPVEKKESKDVKEAKKQELVFPQQGEESVLDCTHETWGVDVHITPERVVLLDSQPLQSAAVLASMIREDVPLPQSSTMENTFELQSIQLALFMQSVCHVLIVATDWGPHVRLWKLLRTTLMLRASRTFHHSRC